MGLICEMDCDAEQLALRADRAENDVVYLAAENERLRDAIDKAITFLGRDDLPGVALAALKGALA